MLPQQGNLVLLAVLGFALALLPVDSGCNRGTDAAAETPARGSAEAAVPAAGRDAEVSVAQPGAPLDTKAEPAPAKPAVPAVDSSSVNPAPASLPRHDARMPAQSTAARGPKMNLPRPPVRRPTDGRPVLLTAMGDTIPYAPMGEPIARSPLEDSPGYQRVIDPESTAVLTGRRQVAVNDLRLGEGARSAEELALWILDALRASDREQFKALLITPREFGEILWPEFPESRPITRLEAKDSWFFLERTSLAGLNQALNQLGGAALEYDRITYEVGYAPYTNFALYHGVRIHAHRPNGEVVVLDFADSFVQCRGTWKVYTYKD